MDAKNKAKDKSWAGIILVVLGLAFLMKNLNLVIIPSFFFSWKTLLIVIGLVTLALGNRGGFVPLIIGTFFLLVQDIFHVYFSIRELWPIALVIIGVAILLRNRRTAKQDSNESSEDLFDEVAVFSGLEKKIVSESFQGGKTSAIFGGADIDLRKAKLSTGKNVIDIFAMFGGVVFKVPPDWTINISELTVLFGAFSDDRVTDHSQADPTKVLNIKGVIIFGGGELKNG